MKRFKISKFNKILFLIFIIVILISIYDYNYFNTKILSNNTITIENFNEIKIYIHKENKFIEKKVKLETINLDEGDFINEIIKNIDFLDVTYKFIASYKYENNIIIKLSNNFQKLTKNQFNDFLLSINKTLKENFKNINNIIIEMDSN